MKKTTGSRGEYAKHTRKRTGMRRMVNQRVRAVAKRELRTPE